MNIFATSKCPVESAKYLDDKRVVKMVLETAQLLSNVMNLYHKSGPYKLTHTYHPCTKWAAESKINSNWLFRHFEALCLEYNKRYGRRHKCEQELYLIFKEAFYDRSLPQPKQFVNCTSYKGVKDTQLAYQAYLNDKWDTDRREPKWYGLSK